MKKYILAITLFGCHAYAGPETLDSKPEGFEYTTADFEKLCELAKKTDTAETFQLLQTHIQKKYSKEEIIRFYDQLQQHLPNDTAWKIYGAVHDAEHANNTQSPYQSHLNPTPAQLWQKCLSITINELQKNMDILKSKELFECAVVKLIDIKVRTDAAQPKSPR